MITRLISACILLVATSVSMAVEKMPSGFYYPTGSRYFTLLADWLERDVVNGGTYLSGYYHTGIDIDADLNDPIYILEGYIRAKVRQNIDISVYLSYIKRRE